MNTCAFAGLTADLGAAEEQIASQGAAANVLNDRLTSLGTSHSSLQDQFQAVQQDLMHQQEQCTELHAKVESGTAAQVALQEHVTVQQAALQALQQDLQGMYNLAP